MNSRAVLSVIALALSGSLAFGQALPPSKNWAEVIEPGESEIHTSFALEINQIQDDTAARDNMPLARGFHVKTHAVMTAEFRVLPNLPEVARQGVFKTPATYPAWIRFSNLKPQRRPDSAADFRAIAVKILDVPGTPLTPGATSLDLMGLNHPLQPARNIKQFTSFVRHSFEPKVRHFAFKVAKDIGTREATRMISWMARNLSEPVMSLATRTFWSTIPIAHGEYAVKYRFTPHNGGDTEPDLEAPNYLRDELTERLKQTSLRWTLAVQFYTDPDNTPIEDAVVVWDPDVAPFINVGELTISSRDLAGPVGQAEEALGDQMLWNSWHAPEAHRPLGGLQRARRVAYPSSGGHRSSTMPPPGRPGQSIPVTQEGPMPSVQSNSGRISWDGLR